jgi:hypothetical protein
MGSTRCKRSKAGPRARVRVAIGSGRGGLRALTKRCTTQASCTARQTSLAWMVPHRCAPGSPSARRAAPRIGCSTPTALGGVRRAALRCARLDDGPRSTPVGAGKFVTFMFRGCSLELRWSSVEHYEAATFKTPVFLKP